MSTVSSLHYKPLWLTGAWGLKLNELSFPLLPETQKKKKKKKEKKIAYDDVRHGGKSLCSSRFGIR